MTQYGNECDLSEIGGHWDERLVTWHGPIGDRLFVVPGRRVACLPDRTWPHEPEDCTSEMGDTTWILDGQVLLCNGCGLDGT